MDEYTQLIREIAREARRFDRYPLTRSELAVIVGKRPDVVGEALCDCPEAFIECLTDTAATTLAGLVMGLLRKKCEAYIETDVALMRDQLEEEERIDNEFEVSHV